MKGALGLLKRHGATAFGLLLLVGAIWVVHREFRNLSVADVERAMQAIRDEESYSFTIEWHRHDYVPADLPIEALDLALDARGVLIELISMRQHATSIPDRVPAAWLLESGE